MSNITEQVNLFTSDKGYRNITIDAIQIVKPINWEENSELAKLLKQNYEKNMKLGKVSYNDKHFMVGEGAVPYYGFGDCSLPLILYHNTPNNSLPVLWYSWEDEVNALFLRITRHLGYRIELGEIETAAGLQEGMKECACIYDEQKKRILLYYTGKKWDSRELKIVLSKRLPQYMIPNRVCYLEEMPHNRNGKVDRKQLKDQLKEKSVRN